MRRPEMHVAIRFAAVLVALVIASACGSGYKGLTKTEFLRQANQSCTHPSKADVAVRKLIAVQRTPERKAKLYLEKVLPLIDRHLDGIAALKPPKVDREQVATIIDQARADAKQFATDLKADPIIALSSADQPFAKSFKAASDYGVKICIG